MKNGGKSRKSGGISKRLINRIIKNNPIKGGKGKKGNEPTDKRKSLGIFDERE